MSYERSFNLEDRLAALFQPDTLIPAQYLDTYRRKTHLEPEKRLMLSVLEDAIACFQKYVLARDGKGREMFREAEEWISAEESEWLFSFDSVCEALGFNPAYVRAGLVRWKEATLQAQPKAKVYQLASRKARRSGGASSPPGTGQRMLQAGGR
jgi:hypothetical protein